MEYGLVAQPPSTEDEIEELRKKSKIELGADVPDGYVDFLRITNGVDCNGLLIFAHNTVPNLNDKRKSIQGFVDANLDHRSLEEKNRLLVFAESGDDLYVYDTQTGKYQLLDHLTLDEMERFSSFETMITYAIEKRL